MEGLTSRVLRALGSVKDPDLGKDLVSLGMVRDLKVSEGQVRFTLRLTTPACPMKEVLRRDCEEAIRSLSGFERTKIEIDFTAEVTRPQANKGEVLPGVRNVIGVASGKGGVGKSTLSANLAIALMQSGARVGLLDADITGPSQPVLFRCQEEQPTILEKEGGNRIIPLERYGLRLLSIGLLVAPNQALVWRGPMASNALRQLFTDTEWGELDYLVVDLPPGTSDIPLTVAQTIPLSGMVIVTTPQEVALEDVRKCIAMCRMPQLNVPILGLIENMSYFQPEDMPEKRYYLFGKGGGRRLTEALNLPLLAEIPLIEALRKGADEGYPLNLKKGPYQRLFEALAEQVAQQIAIHNEGAKALAETP